MHRILIVDDDPTLVDFLKLLLESEGYETYEAYDGRMALQIISEKNPQVVLLDYMMPNMHGLDVLRNVTDNFRSSFVVMLTGKGSEEVAVECMKAGAADYVVKPFDNDHLIGVIRNVVRLREAELRRIELGEAVRKKQAEINSLLSTAMAKLDQIPEKTDAVRELGALLVELRDKLLAPPSGD